MLQITRSPNKPAFSINDGSKSASSKNNNNILASKKNNGNNEDDRLDHDKNGVKHAKKLRKLFKSRKLKSEKMSKSQNLAKSEKSLSKNENLINFDIAEARSKFLIPNTKTAFNHLWLAFTKTLILQHFDPEYHISIETNVLGYAINGVLNQLTSKTNLNEIITKTTLG